MLDVMRSRMTRESLHDDLRELCAPGPAVVTGAGSGIGRALARELADARVDVVLVDVDAPRLAVVAQECRASGARVAARRLDVADRDAVLAHADEVDAQFGAPSLVVTAAGVTMVGATEDEDDDAARRVVGVNWSGTRNGVEAYLPRMEASGRGSFVTIGSAFGLRAAPLQSAYSASKFAVRGYTEALQVDAFARSSPVRVHCVHPGAVRTAIADDAVYTDPSVRRRTTALFDHLLPTTSPRSAATTVLGGVVRGRRRIMVGVDARLLDLAARLTGGPGQHPAVAAATRILRRRRPRR